MGFFLILESLNILYSTMEFNLISTKTQCYELNTQKINKTFSVSVTSNLKVKVQTFFKMKKYLLCYIKANLKFDKAVNMEQVNVCSKDESLFL